MPHPRQHLTILANKPAYIMADTGQTVNYQELEEQANQVAHAFRRLGVQAKRSLSNEKKITPPFGRLLLPLFSFKKGVHSPAIH